MSAVEATGPSPVDRRGGGNGARRGVGPGTVDPSGDEGMGSKRDDEICRMTAVELRRRIGRRQISPVEVVDAVLERVERLNPTLGAFCYVAADEARRAAADAEAAVVRREPLGPLHGVPVSVKDLIAVRGMPFTRGSLLFRDHVAAEDAPAAERVRRSGAIILGKTNTSEFGWKGATSNRLFPETRNPWDLSRTAGGSSGGAAVAAATGLNALALGTDGGGSVRMPSAFCGVFGIKPSVGRVPLYPPAPVGTMSHVGVLARTVDDAAMLLHVLAGPDEQDLYSLPPWPAADHGIAPAETLRIGWSPDLGFMPVDREVREICEREVRGFEQAGCEVLPIELAAGDPTDVFVTLFTAGIGAAVSSMPGWRDLVDSGLARLVEAGVGLTAYELARAMMMRAELWNRVWRSFGAVDLLVTPTVPVTAFPAGLDGPASVDGRPIDAVRWFGLTSTFNLTGQPAASVPCGLASNGLPVGLQIIGHRYDDLGVLRASKTFQELTGWPDRWPPLGGTPSTATPTTTATGR